MSTPETFCERLKLLEEKLADTRDTESMLVGEIESLYEEENAQLKARIDELEGKE